MTLKALLLALLPIILLIASVPAASAFNGNSNAYMSNYNGACTPSGAFYTQLNFASNMITTGSGGNQWSAQVNTYPLANPTNIDWVQFNMAIGSYGNVYGAFEVFTLAGGSIFNYNTQRLTTVGHIMANDFFEIVVWVNSQNDAYYVEYEYYQSSTATYYTINYPIPAAYQVPLAYWQLNIVGENSGSNPYATFTDGSGISYYHSLTSQLTRGTSLNNACLGITNDPITSENSNLYYATPSTPPAAVIQQGFYIG